MSGFTKNKRDKVLSKLNMIITGIINQVERQSKGQRQKDGSDENTDTSSDDSG